MIARIQPDFFSLGQAVTATFPSRLFFVTYNMYVATPTHTNKKRTLKWKPFLWINGWLIESLEFVHRNDSFTNSFSTHLCAYIVAPLGGDKRECVCNEWIICWTDSKHRHNKQVFSVLNLTWLQIHLKTPHELQHSRTFTTFCQMIYSCSNKYKLHNVFSVCHFYALKSFLNDRK